MKKKTTLHSYELGPDRSLFIEKQLCSFMCEQKPFLRFRYKIFTLAEDLNIPAYQLSAFINRYKGVNFTDFLNGYRVKYCEELIRTGSADQLNMNGLASGCGFHNRNTLTTAFKKVTGLTPSQYKKNIKRQHMTEWITRK